MAKGGDTSGNARSPEATSSVARWAASRMIRWARTGGMMRPPVRLIASLTTAVSMPGTALAISAHTTSSPAISAVGTPSCAAAMAKISPSPTVRPSRRTSAYSP